MHLLKWNILNECRCMGTFYVCAGGEIYFWWVGVGRSIFWVGGAGWTFFMCGWDWVVEGGGKWGWSLVLV